MLADKLASTTASLAILVGHVRLTLHIVAVSLDGCFYGVNVPQKFVLKPGKTQVSCATSRLLKSVGFLNGSVRSRK